MRFTVERRRMPRGVHRAIAYQQMGIGKRLLELLRHELGEDEVQYVLTSAPGAVGFYEKLGFERADKAFVIRRKRNT